MMQLNIILYSANAELVKKLEESEKARMDKVLEESDTSKVSQLELRIQIQIRSVRIFVELTGYGSEITIPRSVYKIPNPNFFDIKINPAEAIYS
jgi:hypothetical protein